VESDMSVGELGGGIKTSKSLTYISVVEDELLHFVGLLSKYITSNRKQKLITLLLISSRHPSYVHIYIFCAIIKMVSHDDRWKIDGEQSRKRHTEVSEIKSSKHKEHLSMEKHERLMSLYLPL
jgi:hypothetical protein